MEFGGFFPQRRLQSGSIKVNRVACVRGRVGRCGSMPGDGGYETRADPAAAGSGSVIRDFFPDFVPSFVPRPDLLAFCEFSFGPDT